MTTGCNSVFKTVKKKIKARNKSFVIIFDWMKMPASLKTILKYDYCKYFELKTR